MDPDCLDWKPGTILFGQEIISHLLPEDACSFLEPLVRRPTNGWTCNVCHVTSPERTALVDTGLFDAHIHCWMAQIVLMKWAKTPEEVTKVRKLFFQATAHTVKHHSWAAMCTVEKCSGLKHAYGCPCPEVGWNLGLQFAAEPNKHA